MNVFKRVIAVFLTLSLVLGLIGCSDGNIIPSENLPEGMKYDPTDPATYTIDCVSEMQDGKSLGLLAERKEPEEVTKAADELLKRIEENPDTIKAKDGCKTYYVSNKGNDNNDGLSPETAVATILAANAKTQSGDAVLLERGGFWREQITSKAGVSYGAYGEGNKPTIYTSIDGLSLEWEKVEDSENLWVTDIDTTLDVGFIVFNHGKAVGNRKNSKETLLKQYNFYLEKRGTKLFVYYDGDITKDFYSIEIGIYKNIIVAAKNTTYQNLRLMYSGGFGIHIDNKDGVSVQGCVIGYIGGATRGDSVRLGNGIELYQNGNGLLVDLCHIYQCYDAGVTFQWKSDKVFNITEENIAFTNNLLEYNVYNFEYFLTNSSGALRNIDISGNIMRNAGYGWGTLSRPDKTTPAAIRSGNSNSKAENFVIKNNILCHGTPALVNIYNNDPATLPQFVGNTYIVNKDNSLFKLDKTVIKGKDAENKTAEEIFGDTTGKLVIY